MSRALEYPHIEKPTGFTARLKRIPRIRVAQIVMDYLAHGWSPEEMCRQHAYLTIAEAYSAMLYYWDHPVEIDEEIRQESTNLDADHRRGQSSPFFAPMKSKGLL